MSQTICRKTIERLEKIKKLLPGMFIDIGMKQHSKQELTNALTKAKTIGYKRMPALNIPITNKYKIFTYNDTLYVARIK